jgi:hypothetical protein
MLEAVSSNQLFRFSQYPGGEGKTQKWLALFAQANKGGWVCPGRKAFANSWSPIFTIREFERRSHLTQ